MSFTTIATTSSRTSSTLSVYSDDRELQSIFAEDFDSPDVEYLDISAEEYAYCIATSSVDLEQKQQPTTGPIADEPPKKREHRAKRAVAKLQKRARAVWHTIRPHSHH